MHSSGWSWCALGRHPDLSLGSESSHMQQQLLQPWQMILSSAALRIVQISHLQRWQRYLWSVSALFWSQRMWTTGLLLMHLYRHFYGTCWFLCSLTETASGLGHLASSWCLNPQLRSTGFTGARPESIIVAFVWLHVCLLLLVQPPFSSALDLML